MDREVDWTDPAWDDLAAVAEYIARDSEYYAAAFVEEIKEAAASLAEFAERGQMVHTAIVGVPGLCPSGAARRGGLGGSV